MPTISPLHLDACHLRRLLVDMDPEGLSTGGAESGYQLTARFEIAQLGEGRAFAIPLAVLAHGRSTEDGEPIRVELLLEGAFSLPDDTPEEQVGLLVPLNCLAILYGIARGIVAQATGTTPHGVLWLPPVNFVEMIREQAERATPKRKGRARKTASKRPARKTSPKPRG